MNSIKRSLSTAFLIFLTTLLVGCGNPQDEKEVREIYRTFKEFKETAVDRRGGWAADLVSNETLDYYNWIREKALTADREELEDMSMMRQVVVLSMRTRVPAKQLQEMNGKELYKHYVSKGWLEQGLARDMGISKVKISGDTATALMKKGSTLTNIKAYFVKQDGTWRFDLIPSLDQVEKDFLKMCKRDGITVSKAVKNTTGKIMDRSAWDPPVID